MNQTDRKITIGRDAARDIPLGDHSVSAYHAELSVMEDGRLLLTDCRSTNGTFVIGSNGNARRIQQAVVKPTDRIRFGAVTLTVSVLLEAKKDSGSEAELKTPPKPPTPAFPVSGQRLVRCPCGCIKPDGECCPECGQ